MTAEGVAAIDSQVLATLVPGPSSREQADELFGRLKKTVYERALGAELTHHLGYAPGQPRPPEQSNHRNGSSAKTVVTDAGALTVQIPRDRDGSFEPLPIGKHERRVGAFDDKIVALYARGMTVREIQGHLQEMYGLEVAPTLISTVSDAVLAEVERSAAMLDKFAANYGSMTDEAAKEILKEALKLRDDRNATMRKYAKKLERELPAVKVLQWVQIENKLNTLLDVQAAAVIPIAQ